MDLVTLITACALGADPKLMHALVWHQSGGEPWTVAAPGERNPRVYSSMQDAIRETRDGHSDSIVRVGLAGVPVSAAKVSASVFLPCRNVAMAAVEITKHASRCKSHPRLKADPIFCAVAVHRGSWAQPAVKFASDVAASVAKGDAPNFDLPSNTSTEIFDIAEEPSADSHVTVVDMTPALAGRARSWSSALFPLKSKRPASEHESGGAAPPALTEPSSRSTPGVSSSAPRSPDHELFVRRSMNESPR